MSGGSWDYLYSKINDAATALMTSGIAERRAFGRLLAKCADAMHDIEWVDSCDYGPGDELPAIRAALGGAKAAAAMELQELIAEGLRVAGEIDSARKRAQAIAETMSGCPNVGCTIPGPHEHEIGGPDTAETADEVQK